MNTPEKNSSEKEEKTAKVSFLATVFNVLSAVFGVRSSKLRDQDFTQNKLIYFVLTAIGFVVIFILTVFSIVQLVLEKAS